ncbi:hypothetical protein RSOL_469030 [Rhizoctonia solani AG-3 Rhs1AP]|uniref:DUF6593 domain-containing protein n=1 Tax=Rhizoctonia solani AG-3 Rhs1AP TaxID=1086054 RepID=X8JGE5_9AGAM|nr:hypothetical protein RSOL_469030 [Rhizoctonia solani AG-3 Rhs1AP]
MTFVDGFYLIDETGSLTTTQFRDVEDRLTVRLDCTMNRPERAVVMLTVSGGTQSHLVSAPGRPDFHGTIAPDAVLDYGAKGIALGSIQYGHNAMHMDKYLRRSSMTSGSRKFVGSDGMEYKWQSTGDGCDWSLTNAAGYHVADYTRSDVLIPGRRTSCLNICGSWIHLSVGTYIPPITRPFILPLFQKSSPLLPSCDTLPSTVSNSFAIHSKTYVRLMCTTPRLSHVTHPRTVLVLLPRTHFFFTNPVRLCHLRNSCNPCCLFSLYIDFG